MKYASREFGNPPEVDWTPMIDMTFQLIAFFMFTLSFAEADINERIRLPSSELAKPPEEKAEKPLTLQLTREGTVLYGGDEVPLEGMSRNLEREAEVLRRQHADDLGVVAGATIILRADAEAQGGHVRRLIKICQDAGFENFVLRAKEERR